MHRPLALLIAFSVVSTFLGSMASAQPTAPTAASASAIPSASAVPSPSGSAAPADARRDEARAHFEKGLLFFDDKAWDAALVEFFRSREIFPTRAATQDAAICLRMLHRYDEALDMFEALLREFPNLSADDKALAEREIRTLSTFVGRIDLRSGEPGATVVVDSRSRGMIPLAPLRVSVGTHVVRVVKDGFVPFEAQVSVTSEQTTAIDVRLAPLMHGGRLRVIEQSGKVVNVLVDNVVVGKTPWEGSLPVGDHAVALDGEGNMGTPPARAPVRLDQLTPITLAVEELDAKLRIEPTPTVASVALDGVVLGRGLWEGKLRSGPHRVEVAADGYLPAMRDVALAKGERQIVAVPLDRDPKAGLTFREAETTRQEWLARRGSLLTFELRGQGMPLFIPAKSLRTGIVVVGESPVSGPYTADGTRTTTENIGGGGAGGVGIRGAYMYFALPDPSLGSSWHALRIGTGIDVNLGYWFTAASSATTTRTAKSDNHETQTTYRNGDWGAGLMLNVPLTVGYQFGFGTFKGSEWRGLALGVAYAPSLNVLLPKTYAATTAINLAAFEVSVDILDRPLLSTGRVPHGKVFVYVLPPIGDSPLVISIGGGAAWY